MRKTAIYVMICILIINCATLGSGQIYAHSEMLDVVYDDCTAHDDSDGIHEIWYVLNDGEQECHIDHETLTIKYYFEQPINGDPDQYWTDCGINSELAAEIREAYANSMKKWNDVYFYSYIGENQIIKNKVVNVVEGTYSDHNLSIYPSDLTSSFASTQSDSLKHYIELGEIDHVHYSKWRMDIHVDHFYVHDNRSLDHVNLARSRTGAHELGHVLGLLDVDLYCSPDAPHHEELLMGYGTLALRSIEITYKDIAGVAIARGLHTDADHKWLKCGDQQNDGTYKLLCSICNGVRYVTSINGYEYEEYYTCNGLHNTSNMMAVASYRNTDYYKCKYCECVAPFELNQEQDYSREKIDETYHKVKNNVTWLEYEFIEEHQIKNNECLTCLYNHSHLYTYTYINGRVHKRECYCQESLTEAHSVLFDEIISGRYATCLGCNASLDLKKDNALILHGITNMRTANGSYILPNGIIVLVQADLEAYENGTLQFYNVGDQTQTE